MTRRSPRRNRCLPRLSCYRRPMRRQRIPLRLGLAAAALALAGCDLAALGPGRADCGQLSSVECREALLLAAANLGPAPGDVVADRTCLPERRNEAECASSLDWTVVYPLPEARAVALRIVGDGPNTPLEVTLVTRVPEHVGIRLPVGTTLLASPPPRRSPP